MWRLVGVVAASVCMWSFGHDEGQVPRVPAEPRATVLLNAARAYEESLSCVQWKQSIYMPPKTGGLGPTWSVLQEATWFVDDAGTSGLRHLYHAVTDNGRGRMDNRATYLMVGGTRFTVDHDRKLGMFAALDGFAQSGTSLRMIMGHNLDLDNDLHSRGLVGIIDGAQSCEYLEPTKDEPWPGIRAIQVSPNYRADVEVRLDPAEGMAVRLIRTIDTGIGRAADYVVVLSYQRVGDVSVPRTLLHVLRYMEHVDDIEHPVSEVQAEDLAAARSMVGLPPDCADKLASKWIATATSIDVLDRETRKVEGPIACFRRGAAGKSGASSPQIAIISDVRFEPPSLDEWLEAYQAPVVTVNAYSGSKRLAPGAGVEVFRRLVRDSTAVK